MVAFSCSRRKSYRKNSSPNTAFEALAATSGVAQLESAFCVSGSHREPRRVEVHSHDKGIIDRVSIGGWRVLTSSPVRRLAEVRELGCRRVAVRIERFADAGPQPSSEIWQLYDLDGRLEAALQTTPDGRFALLTNYRTRQACRLVAGAAGDLQAVETWKI